MILLAATIIAVIITAFTLFITGNALAAANGHRLRVIFGTQNRTDLSSRTLKITHS
jgi:uncharacterized membrane protein